MIPGYRVDAVLGRGRRSLVYLGQREGRVLALKVARRADLAGMGRGTDFAKEFAVASALPCPHAIQVFEHGVAGEQAFLAMEYAAGPHLKPQAGAVPAAEVFSFLTQAAAALARLHAQGWVHRDVKPANLLLREDGSLALADFGCACKLGDRDWAEGGAVIGTPRYAAPEQSEGAAADPTADVYSLGVVMYELLCGQAPFAGQTLMELLCQHLIAPVPRLPAPQIVWQPLLDAMLAKDPYRRPADGQAVLDRLQHLRPVVLPCSPGHPIGTRYPS